MRDVSVGIDLGTTSVKAIAVTPQGEIIFEESIPHDLHSPKPGYAEEDAELWWDHTKKLLSSIAQRIDRKRIGAVGFSGMVPTLIPVSENGTPLHPSIQQNDARATVEIGELKKLIDEETYFLKTGNTINQQVIFPKYRWLTKNKPGIIEDIRFLMGSYDYCAYRLTGVPNLELNWALESGLWLIREKTWDEDLLNKAGIKQKWLPKVFASTDVIGTTVREVESSTGFPAGIPVIAGSADHVASAFAAGVREEGDLLLKLGGAGDILFATRALKLDKRLFIDYHVLPERFLLNGCMASSGSIVKWYTRILGDNDLDSMTERAKKLPPGSEGLVLLPYFIGEKTPIFDTQARGVILGLSLYHSREHIFRAILEAVAYGFLHHIEVIKDMGFTIRNVYISNGGAKSELWKHILLDVVGYEGTYVPNHPGSSLGAAILAAHGAGITRDWSDLRSFLAKGVHISYEQKNHRSYQKFFTLYRKTYEALKPLFAELQEVIKTMER